MNPSEQVLVVVHPGSACGSADWNLGDDAAARSREKLVRTINEWRGGVIVIDGALSPELCDRPHLKAAIEQGLKRARAAGLVAIRRMGDDPRQVEVIRRVLGAMGSKAAAMRQAHANDAPLALESASGAAGAQEDQENQEEGGLAQCSAPRMGG